MILPKEYSNILWRTSWLSCLSGIFALYKGHYHLAPAPIGVWLTSINYWRHPDYSWRRYIDIIYVHLALAYQIQYAYNTEHRLAYYGFLSIGIVFFPIGVYFYNIGDVWMSTLCHSQLHIFGNISNIALYHLLDSPSQLLQP